MPHEGGPPIDADPVEVRYQSGTVSIVSGPGWYLQVFHKVPTVADLDAVEDCCRALPKPYCVFSVIVASRSVAITGEARKRTDELAKTTADWVKVNAMVVQGSGFFAAMARGIIAGVTWMMSDHPQKVVATVEEGITFAAAHVAELGEPSTPESFRAGVREALKLVDLGDAE